MEIPLYFGCIGIFAPAYTSTISCVYVDACSCDVVVDVINTLRNHCIGPEFVLAVYMLDAIFVCAWIFFSFLSHWKHSNGCGL